MIRPFPIAYLRRWMSGLLVLALALPVIASTTATVAAPNRESAAESKRSFLWEVTTKAGGKLWLFGTVHVGKASFFPFADPVEKAFADADVLVVEADITNQDAIREAAPLMMYSPPDTLESKLPAALVTRLKKQLSRLGIPFEAAKAMRPFILGGLLAVTEYGRLGFDPRHGVDGYFTERAVQRKKPVTELEGVGAQMALLAGLSDVDQEAFIENALDTLEKGKAEEQINGMIHAWLSGDATRLEQVVRDSSAGHVRANELDEIMLYRRNRQMLDKLEQMLVSGKTHFVAVGAMHLIGKRGLTQELAAKGHQVVQR